MKPARFRNNGINVFSPETWLDTGATFLEIATARIAAMGDPTVELMGVDVPVPSGSYRVTAMVAEPHVDKAEGISWPYPIIANLTVLKNDVAADSVSTSEVAGLSVDSGHIGLYLGDKWIFSSSGIGDGIYPLYELRDSSGRCVGVKVDFMKDCANEYDVRPIQQIRARTLAPASLRSRCLDCAVDRDKIQEAHYLVRPGLPGGNLTGCTPYCIGCVEKRMGRELQPNDFVALPMNSVFAASTRLRARRGDDVPEPLRQRQWFNPDAPGSLDPRVPEDLADAMYEILCHWNLQITRDNGHFTSTVDALLADAARVSPDVDPVRTLREKVAVLQAADNEHTLQQAPLDPVTLGLAPLLFGRLDQLRAGRQEGHVLRGPTLSAPMKTGHSL